MCKRTALRRVLALTCLLALVLVHHLEAQVMKRRTDLTDRQNLTTEDIIEALRGQPSHPPAGQKGMPVAQEEADTKALHLGLAPTMAIKVLFAYNSAEVSPESLHNLDKVGRALQSHELLSYRIQIEGHTDNTGSDQYNLWLSERRAQSVKRYLVDNFGIALKRLIIVGHGEREPIADNATPEGRQRNRRVEFVNLGPM